MPAPGALVQLASAERRPAKMADLLEDIDTTIGDSYNQIFECDDDGIPCELVALFGITLAAIQSSI